MNNTWKMKDLYSQEGISKQSHHKAVCRKKWFEETKQTILSCVESLRKDHPRMGAKKLYKLLQPDGIGRDRFIQLLMDNGYGAKRVHNYARTTYSGKYYYPNLISRKVLTGVNQLWVSDITYILVDQRWHYLTFITDVYSRKIVGYAVDKHLHAQANIRALQMALKNTKGQSLNGLIHHSDRGSQYIHKQYLQLLKKHDIEVSMGNKAWENAHAERINGIIKNEYLNTMIISDYEDLKRKTKKVVNLYNGERPHGTLMNQLSPEKYEHFVQQLAAEQKPQLMINY
jgi:transposase InsO family protein